MMDQFTPLSPHSQGPHFGNFDFEIVTVHTGDILQGGTNNSRLSLAKLSPRQNSERAVILRTLRLIDSGRL